MRDRSEPRPEWARRTVGVPDRVHGRQDVPHRVLDTLLSDAVRKRFAMATLGLGNAGNAWAERFAPSGMFGQFVIGLMLGLIWSPCVEPTLGVAALLAAPWRFRC